MSEPPSVGLIATAFYGPAALIAALILLARDVIPALTALARGKIRSQGHGRRMIERGAEPERFRSLVNRRLIVGGAGFLFCIAAGVVLILRNIQFDRLMP